jgi:hypothetical protein
MNWPWPVLYERAAALATERRDERSAAPLFAPHGPNMRARLTFGSPEQRTRRALR